MTDPLTREEIAQIRANAEKGILPTLSQLAAFVRAIRRSWTAGNPPDGESPTPKPAKSRTKKARPQSGEQLDFF